MGHWFDNLTRRLAGEPPSRRDVLKWTFGAGLGAGVASLLDRSVREAKASGVTDDSNAAGFSAAFPEGGGCGLCQEAGAIVYTLTTCSTFDGRPITLTQTSRQPIGARDTHETTLIVDFDGDELMRVESFKKGGARQVRVEYGDEFDGVREARFEGVGTTVNGVIGKRKLLPSQVGDDPSALKFADGKPAPSSSVPTEIQQALKHIFERAAQDAKRCSGPTKATAQTRRRRRAPLRERGFRFLRASYNADAMTLRRAAPPSTVAASAQGAAPESATTILSAECLWCRGECHFDLASCSLEAGTKASLCLIGYAGCLAYFMYKCIVAFDDCHDVCLSPGNDCCPVDCGTGVTCCESGETCVDPTRGVCCAGGLSPCGNNRCCHPGETCIPETDTCCPPGRLICAGACCAPGDTCTENRCCSPTQTCGSVCCSGIGTCADASIGLCCFPGTVGCNGKCCGQNQKCVNGACCTPCGNDCCPAGQVCCGGVCCPAGQTCTNASTQTCSGCPPGKDGCMPEASRFNTDVISGICCPPGVVCCHLSNGKDKCCPPGEFCCEGGGFAFECRGIGGCIA